MICKKIIKTHSTNNLNITEKTAHSILLTKKFSN